MRRHCVIPTMLLLFGLPILLMAGSGPTQYGEKPTLTACRDSAQQVGSQTMTADNQLSASVAAGTIYRFRLVYYFGINAVTAVAVDLAGGTATVATINGHGEGAEFAQDWYPVITNITALGTDVTVSSTTSAVVIVEGAFQAATSGTFVPRFCEGSMHELGAYVEAQANSTLTVEAVTQ